ncbi:hypothetical protein E2C01_000959 [Portunus trituberculatus]|uniref:Uncharacterized protein n=1 Tax=Portunus trituberculatus TaxID=210409 RepID=A0A5B7CLB2_PORTR|nr:hypothetical protein [Portunus trituberculatus]
MNQGQPEETTTTVLYYNPAKQNGKKLDKHSKKTKLNQGKPEMQLEIMNPTILAIGMHIWQHGRRKKDDLVTESSEALRTHTHTWRRQLSGGRLTHSQTPYRLSVTQYLIRTTLRRLRLLLPLYFTMSSLVNNLIVPGHDKDVANTNGTVIQVAARDGENGSSIMNGGLFE